jgi:hypothetical protein
MLGALRRIQRSLIRVGCAAEAFHDLFPTVRYINGGACVGPASELPRFAQSCAEQAKVFLIDQDTDKADEWEEALPVIAIANGDRFPDRVGARVLPRARDPAARPLP